MIHDTMIDGRLCVTDGGDLHRTVNLYVKDADSFHADTQWKAALAEAAAEGQSRGQ